LPWRTRIKGWLSGSSIMSASRIVTCVVTLAGNAHSGDKVSTN
jgi:hypothetical protein